MYKEIISAEKNHIFEQIAFLSEEARKLDKLYDAMAFLEKVESVDFSDSHYGYKETLRRVSDTLHNNHQIVFELECEHETVPMTIIESAKWYQKADFEYTNCNDNGDIDLCYSPRVKRETPAKNKRRPYQGRVKEV